MKRSRGTCSSSSISADSVVTSSWSSNNSSLDESVKVKQPNIMKRPRNNQIRVTDKCAPNSARRSSIYRGVTRHRWTGRFEAHLWDKTSWNNIQNKKGRQVYLGAYDCEEAAARTYDLAALKYWGPVTTLNFPIERYEKEMEEMHKVSKEEYLASLRRQSSGFSRGVSKYRGVARHHHNGRWEARIGRVFGNKYLYLGTYNTQEEAAEAYDMAAIEYRGANAVTNFDMSNYIDRLKNKGLFIVPKPKPNPKPKPKSKPKYNCKSSFSTKVELKGEGEEEENLQVKQSPQQGKQNKMKEEIDMYPRLCPYPCPPNQYLESSCNILEMEPPALAPAPAPAPELYGEDELMTWSFCLDTRLTPLLIPDIQYWNNNNNNNHHNNRNNNNGSNYNANAYDLPNVLDFADNIDLIFDEEEDQEQQQGVPDPKNTSKDTDVNINNEGCSSSYSAAGSSSPSSSSTTTSVSCNY